MDVNLSSIRYQPQKSGKGFVPSGTDFDAPPTVIFKAFVIRITATVSDAIPDSVERMLRPARSGGSGLQPTL